MAKEILRTRKTSCELIGSAGRPARSDLSQVRKPEAPNGIAETVIPLAERIGEITRLPPAYTNIPGLCDELGLAE